MNLIPAQVIGRGGSLSILFAVVIAFLSGCATPSRVPISSDSRSQLGTVTGFVGLRQQEIGTDINRSNVSAATGGGLLGAIIDMSIDNSRAKKAESAVTPVRDALINYQPGNVLAADLQNALATVPGVSPSHIDVRQIIDANTTSDWIKGAGESSVLMVNLTYELSPNFDSIIVSAAVSLHPGGGRLAAIAKSKSGLPPLVYYNVLSSTRSLPGLAGVQSSAETAKLWAVDGGRPARTTLDTSLQELAAMIAYDLAASAPAEGELYKAPDGSQKHLATIYDGMTRTLQGYVEHQADGRVWVRLPTGELSALAQ